MQQRLIWLTTDNRIHIGRKIEQLGILMLFKDKSFGTFAEYINYVKCRICGFNMLSEEVAQELQFLEYMFSRQDKVGQSHFPTTFIDLIDNLATIDKVGNATSA